MFEHELTCRSRPRVISGSYLFKSCLLRHLLTKIIVCVVVSFTYNSYSFRVSDDLPPAAFFGDAPGSSCWRHGYSRCRSLQALPVETRVYNHFWLVFKSNIFHCPVLLTVLKFLHWILKNIFGIFILKTLLFKNQYLFLPISISRRIECSVLFYL